MYTARFRPILRSYGIVLKNDNGIVSEKTPAYGTVITAPEGTPSKEATEPYSFGFIGWDGSVSGTTVTGPAVSEVMYRSVFRGIPEAGNGNTELIIDGTSSSMPRSMSGTLKFQTTGAAMFDFRENSIDPDAGVLRGLYGKIDL